MSDTAPRPTNQAAPEIVERVARAMHAADGVKTCSSFDDESEGNQWDYRSMARAAIRAMREPNEAMQVAGGTCGGYECDGESGTIVYPAAIWRAMIEAALHEDEAALK